VDDNKKFISDNEKNFKIIHETLSQIEKSLELYEIPEEKILKFNSDEKTSSGMAKLLFPMYWALYLQSISD